MHPEQKTYIQELRQAAIDNKVKEPEFTVSIGFDVTKAEDVITAEVERQQRRREFEGTEKPDGITSKETTEQIFPTTAMVWTTIADKNMDEIFKEVEGNGERVDVKT